MLARQALARAGRPVPCRGFVEVFPPQVADVSRVQYLRERGHTEVLLSARQAEGAHVT